MNLTPARGFGPGISKEPKMITLDVSFLDGTHSVATGDVHWIDDFTTQIAESGKAIRSFIFTDNK